MEHSDIIRAVEQLCHNGTHSCKMRDLIQVTGATQQQIMDAIEYAPFTVRLTHNINGLPLLALENDE